MKTKPLSAFLRRRGFYRSTPKLSGEIHACIVMYDESYDYLRFVDDTAIVRFRSPIDVERIDRYHRPAAARSLFESDAASAITIPIREVDWTDAAFEFHGEVDVQHRPGREAVEILGHLRDNAGQHELRLIARSRLLGVEVTDLYVHVDAR